MVVGEKQGLKIKDKYHMSVEIITVDSKLKKTCKLVGSVPEEVRFGGTGTSSFSLSKERRKWYVSAAISRKQRVQQHAWEAVLR